jgi:hypothetical protein
MIALGQPVRVAAVSVDQHGRPVTTGALREVIEQDTRRRAQTER